VVYSIFADTMADMTYQQIEDAAEAKLPVLFPVAVIEEHGPHLPLGTDAYLGYQACRRVKQGLADLGISSLIAPVFYWGINRATGSFAGSFTVRPATMIDVLCDSLVCLKTWGFGRVFLVNAHGDPLHTATIFDAVKKAHEELGVGACFVVGATLLEGFGYTGKEPYILPLPPAPGPAHTPASEFLDYHAGGTETSLMLKYFPALVNEPLARSLAPSRTMPTQLAAWQQSGVTARAITPLGYLGNPAEIDLEAAARFDLWLLRDVPRAIGEFLTQASRP
jgi:creatinine amidohydrolase